MRPYRGKIARMDFGTFLGIIGGLLITILLSFAIGSVAGWSISILFVLLYIALAVMALCIVRKIQNKYLR